MGGLLRVVPRHSGIIDGSQCLDDSAGADECGICGDADGPP